MKNVMGVAWFEDAAIYAKALSVFADPEDMPATFEEWKGLVERQCDLIRYNGDSVLLAEIDPETFPDWCASRGLLPNAQGRTAFVNHVVLEYQKTGRGTIVE